MFADLINGVVMNKLYIAHMHACIMTRLNESKRFGSGLEQSGSESEIMEWFGRWSVMLAWSQTT